MIEFEKMIDFDAKLEARVNKQVDLLVSAIKEYQPNNDIELYDDDDDYRDLYESIVITLMEAAQSSNSTNNIEQIADALRTKLSIATFFDAFVRYFCVIVNDNEDDQRTAISNAFRIFCLMEVGEKMVEALPNSEKRKSTYEYNQPNFELFLMALLPFSRDIAVDVEILQLFEKLNLIGQCEEENVDKSVQRKIRPLVRLQALCRTKIRSVLLQANAANQIVQNVHSLILPESIKQFLLFYNNDFYRSLPICQYCCDNSCE